MTIFDVLTLLCGLALFLFGMDYMGDCLKKSAGSGLKSILQKMTSTPLKGFLLGLGFTAIIQSSSATTVMVVGFVNSGTMTLMQAVGVIMGANVGTAVTAWVTALSGIGGGKEVVGILEWLKPDSWMPILAVIGICLLMFSKRGKKKDIGGVLLGFAVLMVGMNLMSDAVYGLRSDDGFKSILTMFENPILGVIAGLVLTAIVQSSSASVGILQSLTTTGAITYGAAIPIVMGQNIGTCVTALISAIGANKNGRRAAIVHLAFNVIGVVFWLSIFYIVNAIVNFAFVGMAIDMWGVALVHTVFKILSVIAIAPFYRWLEKIALLVIPERDDEAEKTKLLDERLFETPAIAAERATEVARAMSEMSFDAMRKSLDLFYHYDPKLDEEIRQLEGKVDNYEDALGSYLVKLSARDMSENDSNQITKILHIIGDLERISDHSVNIVESVEEIRDKRINFSADAMREIGVIISALREIIDITNRSFMENNLTLALEIEPIEQVIDGLHDTIKAKHVARLKKGECEIENGFILSDLLNNFERVSDHCSNIAGCIIEISKHEALDMHKYLIKMRGKKTFEEKFIGYSEKFSLDNI